VCDECLCSVVAHKIKETDPKEAKILGRVSVALSIVGIILVAAAIIVVVLVLTRVTNIQ